MWKKRTQPCNNKVEKNSTEIAKKIKRTTLNTTADFQIKPVFFIDPWLTTQLL